MFNSVVLDVAISLIFIYLLYSLLATVLSEIIATNLGLRARNLKEAVDRMLNDQKAANWWNRFWDSLKLMKNPKNKVIDAFYDCPEIKYLGSSGIFRLPSNFKPGSFSKALLSILFGHGPVTKEKIDQRLEAIVKQAGSSSDEDREQKLLDSESARYILSLWEDSSGDPAKFKSELEAWFDRTMVQATEWYKRKIQIVLLVLGFFLAWIFYADTIVIVKKLSVDKAAREQMVSLATAYVQNNLVVSDTAGMKSGSEFKTYTQKLDSLLAVKSKLDADIADANSILGIGGWLPDELKVFTDKKTKQKTYQPQIDPASLSASHRKIANGKINFTFSDKLGYLFRLLYHHFFGFLITAFAISLGAPFWFDLLNKMMKLRTSLKEKIDGNTASSKKLQSGEEPEG
ncbi:MAG: hypothetical protein NTV01_19960 [Bacteroidia bacterium]|nr:hypothetical protein [Bacteroidia bacterium]